MKTPNIVVQHYFFSMKKLTTLVLCFLGSISFAQEARIGKNTIGINTGIVHYYGDKSALMNTNLNEHASGLFQNSFGVEYRRNLKSGLFLNASYSHLNQKFNYEFRNLEDITKNRSFNTFSVGLQKEVASFGKFHLNVGAELNYRQGESFVEGSPSDFNWIMVCPPPGYPFPNRIWDNRVKHRDIGVGADAQLNFDLGKGFQLYTAFNTRAYVYNFARPRAWSNLQKEENQGNFLDVSLHFGAAYTF